MPGYLVYLILVGYGIAAEVIVYVMAKIIRKDSDEMDKIFEDHKEKIRSKSEKNSEEINSENYFLKLRSYSY